MACLCAYCWLHVTQNATLSLYAQEFMQDCSSPFLVSLNSTNQDDQTLYMLMEAVMGGELFGYLQVQTMYLRAFVEPSFIIIKKESCPLLDIAASTKVLSK